MAGKYERKKTPVARKPKKQKAKKGKVILLTLLGLLLALLVLVGGVLAFLWFKLDMIRYDDEVDYGVYTETVVQQDSAEQETNGQEMVTQEPEIADEENIVDISGLEMVEEAPEIPDSEIAEDSNVLNILVIGTDERTKDFSDNARSDCMILVSIDKQNKTVKLVSLERGIGAPILEGIYAGKYDWLTHIFRYGGAELLRKTVEHCFKVDVDHYVRFNFTSVRSVVDAIGGIDIKLSAREAAALNGNITSTAPSRQRMVEGVNHMDGYYALHFARLRSIDSDWKRVERQRKVILAAVEAVKGANLIELNELANTVLPMVQTNMTKLEIAELMLYAPNFLKSSFDQMTIPKHGTYGGMGLMQGRGGFAVDYEINNDLLHRFLYEGATSDALLAE